MRRTILAVAAVGMPIVTSLPAFADGALGSVCSRLGGRSQPSLNEIMSCQKALVNREWLLSGADDVRSYLIGRLVAGSTPEPAGLNLTADQARARLEHDGGIVVVPAADPSVEHVVAVRRWNAWVDGKYTWTDTTAAVSDTDGPQINALVGIDYRLTDRMVVGLLGTYESSDLETGVLPPGGTETEGYGGGAYVGVTLTDNLVYSAVVTGTWIDTDVSFGIISGSTDSDRLSITNGVTGYWYFGTTRLSPSVTFAWQKEWQDSFTDSIGGFNPRQTLETGILTFGQIIGHTFALDNGMAIEPWIGANLDWTLINKAWISGVGTIPTDETLDLRMQAGFNMTLAENVQFALIGEVSGILLSDTDSYAGEATLAIQF
jgi:outer membrane autotransporter protein